jgi:hypothetical protein
LKSTRDHALSSHPLLCRSASSSPSSPLNATMALIAIASGRHVDRRYHQVLPPCKLTVRPFPLSRLPPPQLFTLRQRPRLRSTSRSRSHQQSSDQFGVLSRRAGAT